MNWALGTETTVRSTVRSRVERRPMSSTVPWKAPTCRSRRPHWLVEDHRDAAEDVLDRLWPRKAMARPATPAPASSAVTLSRYLGITVACQQQQRHLAPRRSIGTRLSIPAVPSRP